MLVDSRAMTPLENRVPAEFAGDSLPGPESREQAGAGSLLHEAMSQPEASNAASRPCMPRLPRQLQ
jgi:hypothetical protein